MTILLLAIGGALGTLARYGVNGWLTRAEGFAAIFPLGTMFVNVTGCFLIGVIASVSGPGMGRVWLRPEWRDFLMVGFCGGYTTFSSFGQQTMNLARDGEWFYVVGNVLGSNLLGLLAVYLGWVCGRLLQGGR